MYGVVDTRVTRQIAAKHVLVCSIDNSVNLQPRDVALPDADPVVVREVAYRSAIMSVFANSTLILLLCSQETFNYCYSALIRVKG
mmetsp:Transcript_19938/g.39511  ORF Transcript_19938/g.39511 Transcript_19938/m.39511 type:complete len:85 (+) Transcript_19938:877-1131(+)